MNAPDHNDPSTLSVAIAGSTNHTLLCAKSLAADNRFTIHSVITPSPRPIGRKQIVTKNPMHLWAEEHHIPVVLVEKKIDDHVKEKVLGVKSQGAQMSDRRDGPAARPYSKGVLDSRTHEGNLLDLRGNDKPDLLLVVDFGYIVPQWLLDWPTTAPVNIHPSDLPKYRGSSPGQFVLLFGETNSAVSVIVMDEQLDHGPIIATLPFAVKPTWTAQDYYDFAFDLIQKELGNILASFSENRKQKTDDSLPPQPDASPTPIARRFTREDGFVPFATFTNLISNASDLPFPLSSAPYTLSPSSPSLSPLDPIPLLSSYALDPSPSTLFDLYRALTPWPGIWTLVPTNDGEKRVKILAMEMNGNELLVKKIQIEGKAAQQV